jgi:hypothetical protein
MVARIRTVEGNAQYNGHHNGYDAIDRKEPV